MYNSGTDLSPFHKLFFFSDRKYGTKRICWQLIRPRIGPKLLLEQLRSKIDLNFMILCRRKPISTHGTQMVTQGMLRKYEGQEVFYI